MVGDTLLFWRIGLFLCKNEGNWCSCSEEREMEQFSLPHICTCCLTPSSLAAAGYEPQLRVRPGPEMASATLTMSPFPPPLPAPAAPLTLCFGAAGLFTAPLLRGAEGLLGVLQTPSLQSWGRSGMWHGGNEACLALE